VPQSGTIKLGMLSVFNMKKRRGKKWEEGDQGDSTPKQEKSSAACSFNWEKLSKMKEDKTEFFAGDGFKRLRIVELDEKAKSIHMMCELGKITWPLKFEKLQEVHTKIHSGKVELLPYEIDRLIPTWGNFVAGLFRYLGCDKN
jgi:hypothetical protein